MREENFPTAGTYFPSHNVQETSVRREERPHFVVMSDMDTKVWLLSKNNAWECEIAGNTYTLDEPAERLLAFSVFGCKEIPFDELRHELGSITGQAVGDADVGEFVRQFEKTHKTEYAKFDINHIKDCASIKKPFLVPSKLPYKVVIDYHNEKQLIGIMKEEGKDGYRLMSWFLGQYIEPCLSVVGAKSSEKIKQAIELTDQFCKLYGISVRKTKFDIDRYIFVGVFCLLLTLTVFGFIFAFFA